jgi:hypothetical protein
MTVFTVEVFDCRTGGTVEFVAITCPGFVELGVSLDWKQIAEHPQTTRVRLTG